MSRPASIVPSSPDDVEVYRVLDDFGGRIGRAWCETDEERIDRETVITDLLEGQYSDPVRVVAFNTAEGWSRDVSEDIAKELALRLALEDCDTSATLQGFVDRYAAGHPA